MVAYQSNEKYSMGMLDMFTVDGDTDADKSAQKVEEEKEHYEEIKAEGGDTAEALEKVAEAREQHMADVIKETADHDKIEE